MDRNACAFGRYTAAHLVIVALRDLVPSIAADGVRASHAENTRCACRVGGTHGEADRKVPFEALAVARSDPFSVAMITAFWCHANDTSTCVMAMVTRDWVWSVAADGRLARMVCGTTCLRLATVSTRLSAPQSPSISITA